MSSPTVRTIDAVTYRSWYESNRDQLLDRGPFHEPSWLDAAARGTGFRLRFAGVYEGPELTAVVPGFIAPRGPVRMFGSPLRGTMTSYLGATSLDARWTGVGHRELTERVADHARRRWHVVLARTTVRNAPDARVPMPGPRWHEQRPGSYRLDLTIGEDALFANLKSSCRRNVRKAGREGVEMVPLDDHRVFFHVLEDTFRRHGSKSWQRERYFASLMEELGPLGMAEMWGARYEDEIIAAGLFFHDERELHFIAGGSLAEHGSLPTSYLMHWHAIERAARAGLQVFNSEASKIASIDQFKETFNPVLERRNTLIWARQPIRLAESSLRRWNRRARTVHERPKVQAPA